MCWGRGGILAPPFNKIVGYSCCVCDSFKLRSLRFLGGKSKNVRYDIILQRLLCNFSIKTAAHLELLAVFITVISNWASTKKKGRREMVVRNGRPIKLLRGGGSTGLYKCSGETRSRAALRLFLITTVICGKIPNLESGKNSGQVVKILVGNYMELKHFLLPLLRQQTVHGQRIIKFSGLQFCPWVMDVITFML